MRLASSHLKTEFATRCRRACAGVTLSLAMVAALAQQSGITMSPGFTQPPATPASVLQSGSNSPLAAPNPQYGPTSLTMTGRAPSGAASAPERRPGSAAGDRDTDNTRGRPAATARQEVDPKLTDFQRFVFQSTGREIDLFGYDLFGAPAFPSLTDVPVPTDYVLGPGDEVVLRLWGAVDADLRVVVDRNGQISLPRVGTFRVAGIKASQLEPTLREQVGRVFKNFELSATLGQLRSIQVFVVGQARRPGAYTVSSLSTMLGALFEVGGPSKNGSLRSIQLRRDGRIVSTMDLYKFIAEGDKSADVRLLPGDVIVIPPAGPRVALLGGIDNPAIYELAKPQESLKTVLSYAGSLRALTSLHKVVVERVDPGVERQPRSVIELALDAEGLATTLRDGDVVTLFQISPQFANAVTLRGSVAAPLRYAYKPGMRVSDLIPEREALIQPDYYLRKNMLVQFESGANISLDRAQGDVKNLLAEINWDYAALERLDKKTLRMELLAFNLKQAVVDKNPSEDLLLQPGDVVTVFSVKDIPVPREKSTRLVRVAGEINVAGVYQIQAGETLRSILNRAGGLTSEAYVFGTEFAREATRVKQREALNEASRRLEASLASAAAQQTANLNTTDATAAQRLQLSQEQARRAQLARLRSLEPNGRISLELAPEIKRIDELPDLPLEDGDSILVPARTGFIFAVGAVANNNALLWREGRKVSQYLMAAGVEPAADDDNIFVLRADGSIVHRRDNRRFFDSFESMVLAPGDTLVVPEKLDRESTWSGFVRGLKDWTLILSQFGLSAAAFHSLTN